MILLRSGVTLFVLVTLLPILVSIGISATGLPAVLLGYPWWVGGCSAALAASAALWVAIRASGENGRPVRDGIAAMLVVGIIGTTVLTALLSQGPYGSLAGPIVLVCHLVILAGTIAAFLVCWFALWNTPLLSALAENKKGPPKRAL